ncbi:MAG: MFS transporter, partial [Pseudomonadota bacterium]
MQPESKPVSLLKSINFLPFFLTQFGGALNDNLFKTSLLMYFTFSATHNVSLLNNLAALCFILPFFLFSAWSGKMVDAVEKSSWIQKVKILEIILMICAALAFWQDWTWLLLTLLFGMGVHSTLFGPAKY